MMSLRATTSKCYFVHYSRKAFTAEGSNLFADSVLSDREKS